MDSVKLYKEVDLPRITGVFRLRLPINCEVRFYYTLLVFHSWLIPRAGVKLEAIPSVISYLDVTFHQNRVIADNALKYPEFPIDLYHFYGVVAYSGYLTHKNIVNTINPVITSDVFNRFWYFHSWPISGAGVKLDAVPGCINFIGITLPKWSNI